MRTPAGDTAYQYIDQAIDLFMKPLLLASLVAARTQKINAKLPTPDPEEDQP